MMKRQIVSLKYVLQLELLADFVEFLFEYSDAFPYLDCFDTVAGVEEIALHKE